MEIGCFAVGVRVGCLCVGKLRCVFVVLKTSGVVTGSVA